MGCWWKASGPASWGAGRPAREPGRAGGERGLRAVRIAEADDRRWGWGLHWLERPWPRSLAFFVIRRFRVRSAHLHPCGEVGDRGFGELLAAAFGRWHLAVGMIVADGLDQQAGFGVAGDDDRTVDAAFQEFLLGIHDQGAPDSGGSGAVALVTMLCQNRTDTVLE